MESLLGNYSEGSNFWKLYPTFKKPKLYEDLYKNDKSKGKSKSSKIMWSLIFMFDKTAVNPYKNMQSDERLEVINEDILQDGNFDWEPYLELLEFSKKLFMTEIERSYYSYLEKMEERRKLIEDTEYTLQNAETLDKMIKGTEAVRKELENLEKLVNLQESNTKTKGDIIESAGEKGLI
jgi:hypothetical protein